MADAIEELKREAKAVASAPTLLAAVLLVLAGTIWAFMHWTYGAMLAGKNTHIASLERRIAEYREGLNGASPEDARRRIETMEAELTMLRIRISPRGLTKEQQQAISDRSRRPAGTSTRSISLIVEEGCSDCNAFAGQIADALRVADNWVVAIQVVADPGERPRSGLGILLPEVTRPPPEAVVLQQALRSAGLAFSMLPAGPGSPVELLVTERGVQ